jgi:hypothetical protein
VDLYYNNVSLLLPMFGDNNGTVFTDCSPAPKTVSRFGDTKTVTTESKYYGSSGHFDGTGDYLQLADSADWHFGYHDFTIEFWVNFTSIPGAGAHAAMCGQRTEFQNNESFGVWYEGTNKWTFTYTTSGNSQIHLTGFSSHTPSLDTWYHIAVVRVGSDLDFYIDGQKQTTKSLGTHGLFNSSSSLMIGAINTTPTFFMNGYFQDFRITKGVARYTADFTPPTNLYIPMDISGIVTDQNNNPVSKKVRLYERTGGVLISEQMSSAIDGSYSFNVIENPYNVVVLTEDSNFNDLIRKINV